jgi:lipopolysaccharide assembly outer membrane protein LptD (OstA)
MAVRPVRAALRRVVLSLVTLLGLIAASTAGAQGAAPAARGDLPPGPPLNIAADNVTGSHGPEGDIVLLNGHVRITRARTVITADNGRYLRTQGLLDLTGHVKLVDSTTTVTCDQATFSENEDVLRASGHVTITDRDAVLNAPAGTYDRRSGRIDLTGGVEGRDKDQQLRCDAASYDRDSMLVRARGSVHGFDEPHKLALDARAMDFDRRTREAVATGEPVLTSRDERGRVTRLRGTTLRVNTETRVAEALDSVTVERDTLRARGDYALFDDRLGRGWLLGHPRVYDDQTSVTGDTLEFWSEQRVLKRVRVRGNAVVDYKGIRPATTGESSRLTGDEVQVYFRDEDIDSLVAVGTARNEYQALPTAGHSAERNLAKGDTITVFFKEHKIDRARVQGAAAGEYHLATALGDTTAARREVVRYDAPVITFEVPRSRIVLDRSAHLTYGDLELRARRVEYDVQDQTLTAEGHPVLHEKGDEVAGHLMTYDLTSRVGTIYQAETAYEKGLYHGDRIRRAGENQLDVLNGSYSTCDLAEPHYHFASHYMKIYLKDKLVAKPVVFYVEHVPLFALPFYVFPIKPGRHSGFLFPQTEFGVNNAAGRFIRNAGYYWAPNDYFDLTGSGDYYQSDPSWILRGEGEYKVKYLLSGDFFGSYARNDRLQTSDWDFNAHHNQDVTARTRLTASGEFISSRNYNAVNNYYGRTLEQRLNRFLTSNVSLSHAAEWANFSAFIDRRQDLDADVSIQDPDGQGPEHGPPRGTPAGLANLTASTPSLSVTLPTRTIGSVGLLRNTWMQKALSTLYFSFDTHYLSQYERRAFVSGYQYFVRDTVPDSTTTIGQHVTVRRGLQTNMALSDSRRLFGWLNLQPRLNTSIAVFDHDVLGNQMVPAGVWSASATSGTTFYGTFNPHLGALTGLRHVVVPNVTFSFSPEFPGLMTTDSLGRPINRFSPFDGIGVSGARNQLMTFSLDQRLQAKVQRRDQVLHLDNLLLWTVSGAYDFLYREHHLIHPLSPLNSNVLIQPPGLVNAAVNFVADPYAGHPVRTLTGNTSLSFGSHTVRAKPNLVALPVDQTTRSRYDVLSQGFNELWTVALAYSYSGGYASTTSPWAAQQTGNLVGHYQVSPGWTLDFSASYDITHRQLLTHRFAVTRDLHCWSATFTRDFTPGAQAEYYFRIAIKDQREVYVEHGSRASSLGGIQ